MELRPDSILTNRLKTSKMEKQWRIRRLLQTSLQFILLTTWHLLKVWPSHFECNNQGNSWTEGRTQKGGACDNFSMILWQFLQKHIYASHSNLASPEQNNSKHVFMIAFPLKKDTIAYMSSWQFLHFCPSYKCSKPATISWPNIWTLTKHEALNILKISPFPSVHVQILIKPQHGLRSDIREMPRV